MWSCSMWTVWCCFPGRLLQIHSYNLASHITQYSQFLDFCPYSVYSST
jgi:hypothetical protein